MNSAMIDTSRRVSASKGIRIRWALYEFEAKPMLDRTAICVSRSGGGKEHVTVYANVEEEAARQWLGDMGLDSRQARRILDAAIRGVGPFARVDHPRRVAVA